MSLLKIPDPEYFALERMSNSKLRDYERCPNRYFLEHVKKVLPPKATKALLEGAAAHCLTLEGEEEYLQRFVVKPNFAKNEAGDEKAKLWAEENLNNRDPKPEVLSPAQDRQTRYICDSVWEHPQFKRLYNEVQPEVEIAALFDYEGMKCKSKLDLVSPLDKPGRPVMIDMKTTQDARPEAFIESMYKWSYYAQFAFYSMGAHLCGYPPPEEWDIYVIVADKQCPVRSSLCKVDPEKLAAEHDRNRRTLRRLKRSIETNVWKADWQTELHLL